MPPCAVPAQKTPGRAGSATSDFTSAPGSGYRYHAPGAPCGASAASGSDAARSAASHGAEERTPQFTGEEFLRLRVRPLYSVSLFFLDGAVEVLALVAFFAALL